MFFHFSHGDSPSADFCLATDKIMPENPYIHPMWTGSKYETKLRSEIQSSTVLKFAVLVFRTCAAKFAVDECAADELAVYPICVVGIGIHKHAVLKPAIHYNIAPIVVLVGFAAQRGTSVYTETEELNVIENTVHHAAVPSYHALEFHVNDIEVYQLELLDFCHSEVAMCVFHYITPVKSFIYFSADPFVIQTYSVLFSVGV